MKPKSDIKITIRTEQGVISEDSEVAAAFNEFFVTKISLLKENISPSQTNANRVE